MRYTKYTEKHKGFPKFAWLGSDPSFAIGRNYGDLRIKARLYKQYRVEKVKRKLEKLEESAFAWHHNELNSIGWLIEERNSRWGGVLAELDTALTV